MKKYFKTFLKLIISGLLIYFLFTKIDLRLVSEQIREINLPYFLAALALIFICWIINSKKWQILLRHLGVKEKLLFLLKLNLVSIFYAAVLPGGQLTGETIKCYKITKNNSEKGKLIFSVFMDRLTGLWAMIFLGITGFLITQSSIENYHSILKLFLVLMFGCLMVITFFNKQIGQYLKKIYLTIQTKINKEKPKAFIKKILDLFFSFGGAYKVLSISLIYSFLFQLLNSLSIYFLSLSLNLRLAFIDLLWINALVSIIVLIPVTILGLGLREGSFVYLLSLLRFANVQALSLSLLISLVYLLTGALGGIIELYEAFIRKKQIKN